MTTEATEKTPLLEETRGLLGSVGSAIKGGANAVGHGVMGGARSVGSGMGHAASYASQHGVDVFSKLGSGYKQSVGWYDRLFLKHVNRAFGDHMEVASRGAVFIVVLGLPFVLPSEICPSCKWVVDQKLYTAASITYFIYTLYVYTGDILHFAQGGIMGTFLAVLNIWMMQGFMPGGYTLDESHGHRWWAGSVWGMVFVFLILWLKFDDNTRIFALSTYVWYWMAFLMPEENAGFAQNFEIRLDGRAMKELMVAAAGCLLAVVAGYFPYPIYAQKKALDLCAGPRSMLTQIYFAKKDFLSYYCRSQAADRLKVQILAKEMETLQAEANSISGLLDSSWYECLGMGYWQRQRVMMTHMQSFIVTQIDLLSNAFGICLDEQFDTGHQNLMGAIHDDLMNLVESNGEILKLCVVALKSGEVVEDLKEAYKELETKSQEHMESVTEKFRKQRKSQGMDHVTEDCAGENVVALTFSLFTLNTKKLFESLEDAEKQVSTLQILGVFDPVELFDKDHISWAVRNWLSIVLAFYAGWHGYNQYIHNYNAALASTVSVLLSKFVGSAMTKNLARLQGVVIGIVLGNLLYAFLGWCYWWGHLFVGIALYFWALMGLFMYFHSTTYSTVGLLLVVFGTQSLLKPCANSDTDPSGHSAIVNVTSAIVIMTLVDFFLSTQRASEMATKSMEGARKMAGRYLATLFNDKVTEVPIHLTGELATLINDADALGVEAAAEPRYWRLDWPDKNFNKGIECLRAIRFGLKSIETAVLKDAEADANSGTPMRRKDAQFQAALKLPEFQAVSACLVSHYNAVFEELEESFSDNVPTNDVFEERLNQLETLKCKEMSGSVWQDKMAALVDALEKNVHKPHGRHLRTRNSLKHSDDPEAGFKTFHQGMADDSLAELSVFLQSLKAMFQKLDEVVDVIVKSGSHQQRIFSETQISQATPRSPVRTPR